jgi:hypothetical protein
VSSRSPAEVSLYLGLATAIASFSAAAVLLGLLDCSRARQRLVSVGVLLLATLGIAAALATVARGRTSGTGNVLIGAGVFSTAAFVLMRAMREIFTAPSRPETTPRNATARNFSTRPLSVRWSLSQHDWHTTLPISRLEVTDAPHLADTSTVLRTQLSATMAAFIAIVVLAAWVAVPDFFDDFLRSRPVGQPTPGAQAVVAATARDPAGGPPWAMRVANQDGDTCVQAGRLVDGAFGQVQRGEFRALPDFVLGTCSTGRSGAASGANQPLLAVERPRSPDRTIVYGLVAGIAPVDVRVGNQQLRAIPGPFGAFLTIFASSDRAIRVTYLAAGKRVSKQLSKAD